jgi:polar amino acid transport system substrate-binding protein
VEIVEALRNALRVTAEIEVVPTARANEYVEKTPNVLVFTYAKSPEREKAGFHFIGPVVTRTQMLWKKKGAPINVGSLADVKSQNLTVGSLIGDWRSKFLEGAGVTVSEVGTSELNLKKLMADRMPLMVSSSFDMPSIAKLVGVDMADVEPVYTIAEASSYLMFSKDTDQATLNKWQNAYIALEKTDFFTKTADKWSQILGAPLKFAPDKGFYVP